MILDIAGAVGLAAVEVPVKQPLSSENSVRLKYSHLPDLPLLDAFTAGFVVSKKTLTSRRYQASKSWCITSTLVQGGNRVCYVWFDGSEFEICTGTQAITVSAAFAAGSIGLEIV